MLIADTFDQYVRTSRLGAPDRQHQHWASLCSRYMVPAVAWMVTQSRERHGAMRAASAVAREQRRSRS